ncbi:hypothetical protein [Mycoplasmopsis felis]|uniref:hypothetical protein n=1 Tax=Mycoplasmopsis felis TaxID=33923 RepID=UPI002AFF5DE9|nr:hypothetical protein [Mycoplasmopsis felis]WQQ06760.1 hypothetical protein RRG37_02805 [Mycoplasmopsis felis]WQQ07541.1 hypothetical protein RRG57_02780 [Mycoplasmopsis felis]WQQ08553.1 hypothetical protein RRG61_00335 [Mycoplasmopsis felis]WRX06956.1 hypothetical protein O7984_01650 [Mycoplasmopsis felis]
MSQINIKNKFNDNLFSLENNKIINSLLQKFKTLNFYGSENFSFDDIAINYSIKGIDKIIQFCNLLYKNKTENLIVLCSFETQQLIETSLDFIYGKLNNIENNKIKLFFINDSDSYQVMENKLNYYFFKTKNNNLSILFLDIFVKKNNQSKIKIIYKLIDKLHQKASDFLIKKSIYFIGKNNWYLNFKKFLMTKENILIISDSIHNEYHFFSEIILVLLATQGLNINKIINGYKQVSDSILNEDVYSNLPLNIFLNFYKLVNNNDKLLLNLFLSYDTFLDSFAKLFTYELNKLTYNQNIINDCTYFPENITSTIQPILSFPYLKQIIYLDIKEKYFDYQPSSNIENDDAISHLNYFTLNSLKEISINNFNNYYQSYTESSYSFTLEIQRNTEEALGKLIGILYWTKIFYGIFFDINPFLN